MQENHKTKLSLKKRSLKLGPWLPWIVIGAVVIFVLVFVLYANIIVKTANSNLSKTKVFVVNSGQGADEVAKNLRSNDLIKNRFIFVLYLNFKGTAKGIKAGEYNLPQNMTMVDIAKTLVSGRVITSKITIPEGWTNRRIAEYLEKNTKITQKDFLSAATYQPERDKQKFLTELEPGESLEGFLYPDTYQISQNGTANEVVIKMLDNFGNKVTQTDIDLAKSQGYSLIELVSLAAVVEREVAKPEDRKLVASVFLNRLRIGMPLESCATVQYILNSNKTIFSYEETRTPSPFNTYINKGLPKGPIGNPSIDSIRAVLYPEKSNYYYFLSSEGVTYFSKTLEEHNAKKNLYLR